MSRRQQWKDTFFMTSGVFKILKWRERGKLPWDYCIVNCASSSVPGRMCDNFIPCIAEDPKTEKWILCRLTGDTADVTGKASE